MLRWCHTLTLQYKKQHVNKMRVILNVEHKKCDPMKQKPVEHFVEVNNNQSLNGCVRACERDTTSYTDTDTTKAIVNINTVCDSNVICSIYGISASDIVT